MWQFLLLAGDFMTDMQQRMKQEEERQAKLDPWKVIFPFPFLPSQSVPNYYYHHHHHHHQRRRRHHHHHYNSLSVSFYSIIFFISRSAWLFYLIPFLQSLQLLDLRLLSYICFRSRKVLNFPFVSRFITYFNCIVWIFVALDETVLCDHSNKNWSAVLSCGNVRYSVQYDSIFDVHG